jgi:hypothetical protein
MDAGDRLAITAALNGTDCAADEIARLLIVPLNDVLEVQEQLAPADAAPRRDLTVAVQQYTTPRPVFTGPAASETFAMTTTPPSPVFDVFTRAEQIDDRRVAAALCAAVQACDILTELVDGYDAQADIRARIAELEEQLAAERSKLQPAKPSVVRPVSASVTVSVSAKEIRAWADSNGVPVPTKGPIPKTVSEQYFAAQQVAV